VFLMIASYEVVFGRDRAEHGKFDELGRFGKWNCRLICINKTSAALSPALMAAEVRVDAIRVPLCDVARPSDRAAARWTATGLRFRATLFQLAT
jgi:hypothetical protein